jgi:hypothetical protein
MSSSSSGVRVRPGIRACSPDQRLSFGEARRQFGVGEVSPSTCRVVATLALHEGVIPLTQRDLVEDTGYTQATISSTTRFLYYTGVTVEGSLLRPGSNVPASTIIPASDFRERVGSVPAWTQEIEYRQLENQLGELAAGLEMSRNEALRMVLAFYEANMPQPE